MKITGIDIGEYRQFKNIKFDFTYPSGHPKAGQPLEKVCFIGQSGTGKTTLLNVIWDYLLQVSMRISFSDFFKLYRESTEPSKELTDIFQHLYSISASIKEGEIFVCRKDFFKNLSPDDYFLGGPSENLNFFLDGKFSDHIDYRNYTKEIYNTLQNTDKIAIFIKESTSREADAFLFDQSVYPQNLSSLIKTDTQVERDRIDNEERIRKIRESKTALFGEMQSLPAWQYLLKDINEYDETTVSRITTIVQNTPKNKVQEELQKWIDADPRHELAEKCLNPILNKFFLEVDINAAKVPITLRTMGGVKIDSSYLSTGTRQILATAIPMYKFDTNDTVILFDEPERSLFPDVQRDLVNYYTSLAPKAQFFFATHSPIIASAFEPCERFILYFEENGEVNYRNGIAPIGDDPNDILSEDFGLQELMLDEGLAAYKEYRRLAMEIRTETDKQRKNELIAKRVELGNSYNF